MTHADAVRAAERAVVEAAVACEECPIHGDWLACCDDLTGKTVALIALRAETCPKCGGTGKSAMQVAPGARGLVFGECPAGCDNGRRRP